MAINRTLSLEAMLDRDVYYEIGLQMVMASHAEAMVTMQILRFFGEDYKVMPLAAKMPIKVKLKALQDITTVFAGIENAKPVIRICDNLRDRFNSRHDLAHGVLHVKDGPEIQIIDMNIQRKPRPRQYSKTTQQQIRENTFAIEDGITALATALNVLGVPPLKREEPKVDHSFPN